jgi:hypothetical protein
MSLPDQITKATDYIQLLDYLKTCVPADIWNNRRDAFHGLFKRAYELGLIDGEEQLKAITRIRLGLEARSIHV